MCSSNTTVSFFIDLSCRFNAAYCTALEGEALPHIFGQMDIVADTLPDMADKMIAASGN